MDKFDSYIEILQDIASRTLDWEEMCKEDKARFKAVAIQFKRYFDDMLYNIEVWESIYGKVMEVGNYDMLLQ